MRYIEGDAPLLSLDEERKLTGEFARTRDPALEQRLVLSNLRLVVPIARHYCRDPNLLADLIQEGNIGLLHGVRRFDPTRGVRLPTYATFWIRAYVLKAVLANLRLVKAGTKVVHRKVFFRLGREQRLLNSDGTAPDSSRLARRFHMAEAEFARLARHLTEAEASLDAPLVVGGSTLGELLPGPAELRPDVQAERDEEIEHGSELRAQVDRFAAELSARDRTVIRARWLEESPPSLARLGRRLGISRERVRQLEQRCRRRFQEYLQHPPRAARRSAMGARR